jgi:hypothetical protein
LARFFPFFQEAFCSLKAPFRNIGRLLQSCGRLWTVFAEPSNHGSIVALTRPDFWVHIPKQGRFKSDGEYWLPDKKSSTAVGFMAENFRREFWIATIASYTYCELFVISIFAMRFACD